MPATYNILIMGASYGSLLASKLLFGGHQVKLVCLPAEADLINAEGFRVRLPIKGRKDPIEIDSRKLPGKVSAGGPADVDPTEYDLVGRARSKHTGKGLRMDLNQRLPTADREAHSEPFTPDQVRRSPSAN